MRRLSSVFLSLVLLLIAALPLSATIRPTSKGAFLSVPVRAKARSLANSWVDTAGAGTLDSLSNRAIAFAGMVPGVFVRLDGKRMNASQALMDSALTIIKSSDNDADARAIRNTVYVLMEIAEGRATK